MRRADRLTLLLVAASVVATLFASWRRRQYQPAGTEDVGWTGVFLVAATLLVVLLCGAAVAGLSVWTYHHAPVTSLADALEVSLAAVTLGSFLLLPTITILDGLAVAVVGGLPVAAVVCLFGLVSTRAAWRLGHF